MSDVLTYKVPITLPHGGQIGGHTPDAYGDIHDIGHEQGIYSVLQNMAPQRAGQGSLTKRQAVGQAIARDVTDTERIVNLAYQTMARQALGGNYGALFMQLDNDDAVPFRYAEYLEDEPYKFDASKFQTSEIDNVPTMMPTASGAIHPGTGLWLPSVRGYLHMAMGKPVRVASAGGTEPCIGFYANRDNTTALADGFFAHPNSATATERGGRVARTGWHVVPAKPWTSTAGFSFIVHPVLVYAAPFITEDFFHLTGYCYWGVYTFWLVPVDDDGEEGPPIARTVYYLDSYQFDRGDETTKYARGISFILKISGFDGLVANLRPSIRSLRIYGKYVNPGPGADIWTGSPVGGAGFALDSSPTDVPPCLVAQIDLNGRQYDPFGSSTIGARGDSSGSLPRSERFNYFVSKASEMRAEKIDDSGTIKLRIKYFREAGDVYSGRRYEFCVGYGLTADDCCHIEIDGFFGTWKIDGDAGYVEEVTGSDYASILLTPDQTDFPDNTAWPLGTEKTVRFCYPWLDEGSDNYRINLWVSDPQVWDTSRPMEWPEDAKEKYDVGYPDFTGHCESPSGRRRLAWGVATAKQRSGWGGWGGVSMRNLDNILYGTTNRLDGFFDTKRFQLSLEVKGKVTGAAFISEEVFIVTTLSGGYICEYYRENGQWLMRLTERELPYGNIARSLHEHNRTIYGLDPKYGAWAVGIDTTRIHSEISPIGEQKLLMNAAQSAWFGDTYSDRPYDLVETTIVSDTEKVLFGLPSMSATSPTGDAAHNVYRRNDGDPDAHIWLAFYFLPDGALWSYDFARGANDVGGDDTLPLLDLCRGPGDALIGHSMDSDLGDIIVFAQDYAATQDTLNGVSKSIIGGLGFGFLAPKFPCLATLTEAFLRIGKYGSTDVSYKLELIPWRGGVQESSMITELLLRNGWVRGLEGVGEFFQVIVTDISEGNLWIKELIFYLIASSARRTLPSASDPITAPGGFAMTFPVGF